jgi:DNA (cytosine-5)-methyltransferase 1
MIKGLSLFANIGIAETYFEEIGIDICLANELIERRVELYRHLYPKTQMISGDITRDDVRDAIVSKAKEMSVNFIIATPPCQGMSVAGKRDPDDHRNQLISYTIDIIKRISPLFVLLENVPRQLKTKISMEGRKVYIPDYIMTELGDNYVFNDEPLVKAMNYGVPQRRERNIFLLVRKDLGISWQLPPSHQKVVTLEEAIGGLPSLAPVLREGKDLTYKKFPDFDAKREEGAKVSKWHKPPIHPWRHVEWMMHTPTGKSAIFNDKHFPRKEDNTKIVAHHNHYRRLNWDRPSRTITKFNAYISTLCSVHPGRALSSSRGGTLYSDARALSIYELMIVMSLPSDWDIPEGTQDPFLRTVIGEGIPPKLTKELMLGLMDKLLKNDINI